MQRRVIFSTLLVLALALMLLAAFPERALTETYTMSWSFRTFHNPNARQVAKGIAEQQDGMIEEEEDPIDTFRERLERRLMSRIQRNLIDQITGDEGELEDEFDVDVGDLNIYVDHDEDTGVVTIEITNLITGETDVITYSEDSWVNPDYDL